MKLATTKSYVLTVAGTDQENQPYSKLEAEYNSRMAEISLKRSGQMLFIPLPYARELLKWLEDIFEGIAE